MIQDSITETLFVELTLFSILLLVFMLYNNVVLYKMSIKDKLSIILATAIVSSIFDGVWHFVDGNVNLRILNFICADVYAVGLFFGVSMFAMFSLERFGLALNSKKLHVLLFVVPSVLVLFLCLTTPWTELVYSIDESGDIQYMGLFDYFLVPLCFLYLFLSILLSVYYVVLYRKKQKEKVSYAQNLLIFALLCVGVESVQAYVLEIDENYLVTSLSWAIGFVFFTTSVNTERFVKSREKIVAVEADLEIAANIQRGALPTVVHALSNHPNVDIFASMATAKEVGGDFYDFFEIDETHICFVIADV